MMMFAASTKCALVNDLHVLSSKEGRLVPQAAVMQVVHTPRATPAITPVTAKPVVIDAPHIESLAERLDVKSPTSYWAEAAKETGIDPLLIYAVALVESRSYLGGGQIAPTPWVVRVDGQLVMGDEFKVRSTIAAGQVEGARIQDVGIMQVFYPLHKDLVPDAMDLIDPRTNILTGSKILAANLNEKIGDLELRVGHYHSYDPKLARYYGRAVVTVWTRLKELKLRPGAQSDADPIEVGAKNAVAFNGAGEVSK